MTTGGAYAEQYACSRTSGAIGATGDFAAPVVEIGDADLDGLVESSLLNRLERHDREAIPAALHQFFDRSLAVSAGHA